MFTTTVEPPAPKPFAAATDSAWVLIAPLASRPSSNRAAFVYDLNRSPSAARAAVSAAAWARRRTS